MRQLPSALAAMYRPATDREVYSWSFGVVKSPRYVGATAWQDQRGTLDDQGIFGPLRDLHCACGKYVGESGRNMICDRCGVKVTTSDVRRRRFGHMDLPLPVPHPLGDTSAMLRSIPVLPATFWQSPAGSHLAASYDALARAATSLPADSDDTPLAEEVVRLFELLLPVVLVAHEWNFQEAQTLARCLALERRELDG